MSTDIVSQFAIDFDRSLRLLLSGAATTAERNGIAPADFTQALATMLVGRAFDTLAISMPIESAVEAIHAHARGAASVAIFGNQTGAA